jgi:RNA polymerase sigma factor (sigma-70 family)
MWWKVERYTKPAGAARADAAGLKSNPRAWLNNFLPAMVGPQSSVVMGRGVKTYSPPPLSRLTGPPLAAQVDRSSSFSMPDEPEKPRDFASLYRTTLTPLRRYLGRLLGNPAEAQDVAHDAYLRVYPSVTNQSAHQPEALLYTTARRLAINRLKRRSIAPFSREALVQDAAPSGEPSVEQQVMARQELSLLQAAIADLPEGCRAVLLLRKVELLSHAEIAQRLGIAISTVEKQHARALRLLRAALPSETARQASSTTPAFDPKVQS